MIAGIKCCGTFLWVEARKGCALQSISTEKKLNRLSSITLKCVIQKIKPLVLWTIFYPLRFDQVQDYQLSA